MALSVFEIAQKVQNQIENDTLYPLRQKEAIRETFLKDHEMPAIMTGNIKKTLDNRFDIQNRQNTWDAELRKNQTGLQLDNMQNDAAIATFDEKQRLEALQREAQTQKYRLDLEEDKFKLDNIDRQKEIWTERYTADLEVEKERRRKSEDTFTSYSDDRDFKTIMNNYPDWESLPAGQKAQALWEASRNKSRGVKERAREKLREDIGITYFPMVKQIEEFLVKESRVSSGFATERELRDYAAEREVIKDSLANFDMQTFQYLLANGIIKNSEVPIQVRKYIRENQLNAVDPATGLPIGGEVDPATGQPAPATASPEAPAAPVEDTAPVAPAQEEAPPVPSEVAPAPIPPLEEEAPATSTDVAEYIAQNSGFTVDEVNAVIEFKSMPKEIKDALTRDPVSDKERDDMIRNLYKVASTILNSGSKDQELVKIAGIVNTRALQLEDMQIGGSE